MSRRALVLLASSIAPLAACELVSPSSRADRAAVVIPACEWPSGASTFDEASGTGCSPRSMLQICEVPEGSVVHADGSITTPDGATVTCASPCSLAEYALECRAPAIGAAIPAPDPSLRCRAIPIPTPQDLLFHCCPCESVEAGDDEAACQGVSCGVPEPPVTVRVVDATTSGPVDAVRIASVSAPSSPPGSGGLTAGCITGPAATTCTVDAIAAGRYAFDVTAPGYASVPVEIQVPAWEHVPGACCEPPWVAQTVHVSLVPLP